MFDNLPPGSQMLYTPAVAFSDSLVFLPFPVSPQPNVLRIDFSAFNIHDMLIRERAFNQPVFQHGVP
jgi:hypothetical protein